MKNKYAVFLLVAVVIQLFLLADLVSSLGIEIYQMRDLSPIQKSALTTWTAEFSEYVIFLRDRIPEDARVILPPHGFSSPIDNVGYMQYMLFPREIHNCGPDEVEACVLRAAGPNTYILSSPQFPPRDLAVETKTLMIFSEQFGVYVPNQ